MARETKFGEQPVRHLMVKERWSIVALAHEIGVTRAHLWHVVRGDTRPSPNALEGLSRVLDAEAEDMFTDEVLSKPYDPKRIAWAEARPCWCAQGRPAMTVTNRARRLAAMPLDEAMGRYGNRHQAVYWVVRDLQPFGCTGDEIHWLMDDFEEQCSKPNSYVRRQTTPT